VGAVTTGDPKPVNRPMVAVASAIAAVVVGVAAWQLSGGSNTNKGGSGTPSSAGTTSSAPVVTTKELKIVNARADFEVLVSADSKLKDTAPLIIDGDPGTSWASDTYRPGQYVTKFGNYIRNPYVALDLGDGTSAQVTKLRLNVGDNSGGARFEVLVGSTGTTKDSKVGQGTTKAGVNDITLTSAKGRFVVIVFSSSPPSGKLQISEADVFGTSG
jgi:hypothetical protein